MKNIAVLGSFDTWSYMDFVAELVALDDCIALTSKYIYCKNQSTRKVERTRFSAGPGELMINFLRDTLIGKSDMAIIIFSVPAGHYNETHWCAEQSKTTLGISFVREVQVLDIYGKPKRNCGYLKIMKKRGELIHGVCEAKYPWTVWNCIESRPCPFKNQGISLNQLEYFMTNHRYMRMFAVENIRKVEEIVVPFVRGKLF